MPGLGTAIQIGAGSTDKRLRNLLGGGVKSPRHLTG